MGSNTSDLTEQQFTTRLTGGEFFLKDHRVQDEKVLPGVAYIEMARAAGQLATKSDVVRIRNMVWSSPVRVNSVAREVSISLYPEGNHIAFEVSSPVEGDERMVHGQGKLEVGDCSLQNIPKSLDIEGIQSRCSELQQGVDCYKAFAGRGLNYGPSFQGIESLSYNDSEALARLKLPDIVTGQAERFVLHPSLLDGALQAVAGLVGGNAKTGPQVTLLPFALSEVMIYGPIPESAYAYVRYSPGVDPQGQVLKYDIEITDELGQVVVKLKEFTVRVLQDARPSVQLSTAQAERGVLYTTTQWYEQSLQSGLAQGTGVVESLVIVDSQEEALLETIALEYPKAEVISLAPRCKAIYKVVETRFIEVFDKIKSCLGATPNRVQQILILVPDTEEGYCDAPLAGLIKTLQLESPRTRGKVIYYPEIAIRHKQHLLSILKQESNLSADHDIEVRYSEDLKVRQVKRLVEVKLPVQNTGAVQLIKPGGVYWLTGGLGGLGRIFALHLGKTKEVKLVVSGRSALDGEKQKYLSALQQQGISVSYIQADISKEPQIKAALKTIKEEYGKLNGIIHSAGVIRDAFFLKKTHDQIKAVLSPKVSGAINLDIATKDERLDFMIFFSSLAGVLGGIGQCDYAGANAFLDAFAVSRQRRVKDGKRYGRTLSIGWPLWRDGGMRVDDQTVRMMEQVSGMVPLGTEAGVDAFDRVLEFDYGHVVVAEGEIGKMRSKLLLKGPSPSTEPVPFASALPQNKTDELLEKVRQELVKEVSDVLKVKKEEIDFDAEMSEYGFDSITLTEFVTKVNQEYRIELMPTVFFEQSTLGSFADYLVEEYGELLIAKYQLGAASVVERDIITETEQESVQLKSMRSRFIGRSLKIMGAVEKGSSADSRNRDERQGCPMS
ncbi:beta-ketoacyl synthase [Candidatus Scalindua japonica]|uniref:Beta-ketoacyl synthase n=1 Tax=Candidatus Scalindua japonica TaxID=1284222 RepID=A0A286TWJ4_9BACT|nr:beta-ketoacyl synthase [Candidatus Scalindua japonica]